MQQIQIHLARWLRRVSIFACIGLLCCFILSYVAPCRVDVILSSGSLHAFTISDGAIGYERPIFSVRSVSRWALRVPGGPELRVGAIRATAPGPAVPALTGIPVVQPVRKSIPLALAVAVPLMCLMLTLRMTRRKSTAACQTCGYDCAGLASICPECGESRTESITAPPATSAATRHSES